MTVIHSAPVRCRPAAAGFIVAALLSGCSPVAAPSSTATPSPADSNTSSQGPSEGCDPELQSRDAPELTRLYAAVWSEPDTAERLAVLELIWADDASFADPLLEEPVVGRDEFNEYLDGFTEAYRGYYFTLRAWTAGDLHNDRIRIRWNFCAPNGAPLVDGADFGVLTADGRLQSIASFYALPWPEPSGP